MRVLILGVAGMLGHKLYQVLSSAFSVAGTIRGDYGDIGKYGFLRQDEVIPHVSAFDIPRL